MMMDIDMDEEFDADVSDAADWDVHKENVQPRKEGRRFRCLLNAIHNNLIETPQLLEDRRGFELRLMFARRRDVLSEVDTWHRYAVWCEESFPRGSSVESGLLGVLERALSRLLGVVRRLEFDADNEVTGSTGETETTSTALVQKRTRSSPSSCESSAAQAERLRNSERFVDLFIKLSRFFHRDPDEVFKFMQNNKIGERCPAFYIAWATQFEANDDLKAASAILQVGIAACSRDRSGAEASTSTSTAHSTNIETLIAHRKRIETRVAEQVAREFQQHAITSTGNTLRTPAAGDRRLFGNELMARPGARGAAVAPALRVGEGIVVQSTPRNSQTENGRRPMLGSTTASSSQRGGNAPNGSSGLQQRGATAGLAQARRTARHINADRENDATASINVFDDGSSAGSRVASTGDDRRAFLPPVFDARYGAWGTLPRVAQIQRENTPASHSNWRAAALDDVPFAPSVGETPFEIFEEDDEAMAAEQSVNLTASNLQSTSFQQAPGANGNGAGAIGNSMLSNDGDLDASTCGVSLLGPCSSFATPFKPSCAAKKTPFRTPRSLASAGLRVRKPPAAASTTSSTTATTATTLFGAENEDTVAVTRTLNSIAERAELKAKRKQKPKPKPAGQKEKEAAAKPSGNKQPASATDDQYMMPQELVKSMLKFGEEEEFRMEFSVEEWRAFRHEEAANAAESRPKDD